MQVRLLTLCPACEGQSAVWIFLSCFQTAQIVTQCYPSHWALSSYVIFCPHAEIPLSLGEVNKEHESRARLKTFIFLEKFVIECWWRFMLFHSPDGWKNLPHVIASVQLHRSMRYAYSKSHFHLIFY